MKSMQSKRLPKYTTTVASRSRGSGSIRARTVTKAATAANKLINFRNTLKAVGATDQQADVAVSQFLPSFYLEESNDKVLERLEALDKKLTTEVKELKSEVKRLEAMMATQVNLDRGLSGLEGKVGEKISGLEGKVEEKINSLRFQLVAAAAVIALAGATTGNWLPILAKLVK
ncbi:hypothetical protein Vretimale_18183 [Volvox reticuliferus]|uniref:DUF1640 domain-containing protein n=1 Tax=Volvox reticuliferus TaxID=1737510 RepID=A0A8J4GWS1_9CHLO|nr:hypothetical protein Vretifemale_17956 [Volvox reticuliferus]GIM15401.1 hypothetical protein Vretimale_18183 [Volvox reticuliferus]